MSLKNFMSTGAVTALDALGCSLAMIEFSPDGHILTANQLFLQAMGYSLEEIRGKHHSIFVDPAYIATPDHHEFWVKLGRGEPVSGEYLRLAKGGREVWLQACYTPVLGRGGRVDKIIKLAMDITAAKGKATADAGELEAISRSQAVIAFDPQGKVLDANDNFLAAIGYDRAEIVGQPHAMFVDSGEAASPGYRAFWDTLRRGEFVTGEFQRKAKGGRDIWLQASYTPVLGREGRVVQVVKVALEITAAKNRAAANSSKLQAISRSQAVIEFDPQGKILDVNDNFLATVGYSRNEIIGQHHAMFVDSGYAASPEYRAFWDKLRNGEFIADEFQRKAKGGRDIWLSANYNPIFDAGGRVTKVVKFATDITDLMTGVATLASGLTHLASGDLQFRIQQPLTPRLEKLRSDFNVAVTSLETALQDVSSAVSTMQSGASEIAQASDDLSSRTEQQAATLEETAAALQEITTNIQKTAGGAKHAHEVVSRTKAEAEKSGGVVREAVTAMGSIEQSSQQIGQIIGVIDEIAFQTNLLALNAGVEAARAGDAGRGFAVVASEVRALAQRSAQAAKEIKALISASAQQVGTGVKLVAETGLALERIMAQVGEINAAVSVIAVSASEQATGLAEVNTAVNQMDQVTQQNAAMVEQSTAACHSLAQETAELARLTGRFQIGQAGAASEVIRPASTKVVQLRTKDVSRSGQRAAAPSRPAAARRQLASATASTDWEGF